MRRLACTVSMAAAFGGAAVAALASCQPPARTVHLASNVKASHLPTAVLVHGLDSSRETWALTLGELAKRGYPALALDLRGHGESELGDPADFGAPALAADVLAAIRAHGVERAVLVGHSMGGRVAMRAAALDAASEAPLLACVVIEDMDLRARYAAEPLEPERAATLERDFGGGGEAGGLRRGFADWAAARAALLPWYGGDSARVDGWRGRRVRARPDGSVWSDINPAAQRLARDRVLASADGGEAWDALGAWRGALPFAVHVWHADAPGSVVALDGADGIEDMAARLPAARVRRFAGAAHSIHTSKAAGFAQALCEAVDEAAREL